MYGRTIKMTANQIVRKQDEKIGTAVLLSDITEQANREKLRREFSANVSHELKTPLTVISGFAELMANGAVKASDIKTFSEKIHTESKHLLSLINDIIELSKLDENSNLTFEKVDLYDFAKESMERIKEKADEKNISLDLTGEEAKIEAVAYLLDEILFNILDNAVKYNRENGKIVVEIKQEKGSAVLLVSDTGIGIAKAEQSRVFERFYRIDSSRGGRQDGTGLGLSIVKNAVQINGGKISLSSVEGEWTRVSVKFPLSK
jgi:two-component system phosphate regulon sensor histidine kinase PhoR